MKILDKLRQLDAYPKTLEDFSIKTPGGAAGLFEKYIYITHLKI